MDDTYSLKQQFPSSNFVEPCIAGSRITIVNINSLSPDHNNVSQKFVDFSPMALHGMPVVKMGETRKISVGLAYPHIYNNGIFLVLWRKPELFHWHYKQQ